jgi:hypothetical protein
MKRGNAAIVPTCLTLLCMDLASPGQFRLQLPIAQLQSIAALKPAIGNKIKSGMAQIEAVEFIGEACPTSNPQGISAAQIKAFAAARPESGITADQVQALLGLPDCADGAIARYFAADGQELSIGYKAGKTTGYEIKHGKSTR